jgi:hypothetical protein
MDVCVVSYTVKNKRQKPVQSGQRSRDKVHRQKKIHRGHGYLAVLNTVLLKCFDIRGRTLLKSLTANLCSVNKYNN